jgi:hypothetical protein
MVQSRMRRSRGRWNKSSAGSRKRRMHTAAVSGNSRVQVVLTMRRHDLGQLRKNNVVEAFTVG